MKLYIVPTPIGNLQDITFRAIDVLKSVDAILAEDTRKSRVLLNHFSISTKLESFHKFNEHDKLNSIINRLLSGEKIALVSDAGTPGISDPGFLIIREAVKNEIDIETLPGATAFVPALVNSGLPCDKFVFEGFLPAKKGRQKRLKELAEEKRTMVFYESPYRIAKAIDEFIEYFGEDRLVSITREISKIYEENIRGTAKEVKEIIKEKTLKGEFVIVVQGKISE
ncbi:MAG: 16S rRNA (cytidine(1402)-2'-O)-methyltransferase [Bacteroidales bacterium]|nr:16S rRNA (cytidine(1402)-2'-O)-methyltransferase [Bacteroidales bacterium]